ncbi:MAG TPA: hypothetical protein VMT86_08350 [Bryobacteraceae bacterium]|nr:hypothetical protein [Bryobacteraceae bacterium]
MDKRNQTPEAPATVILLDLLQARFEMRAAGWREMIEALQHVPSPERTYFYLLSMRGRLEPVHPIAEMPPGFRPPGPPWTANIGDTLNQLMHG